MMANFTELTLASNGRKVWFNLNFCCAFWINEGGETVLEFERENNTAFVKESPSEIASRALDNRPQD